MSKITIAGQGVLVTGCSSGIGRATALHLARAGFTVFATVRRAADAEALNRLGLGARLVPVCSLDLSRAEDIAPAVEFVRAELECRGLPGLYAVVNNAGGGTTGPLELMDLEMFRDELAARILGPLALLQGCLPLLRAAKGRIVWITTPALLPVPYVGSIHVPDFAVNCLVRTLDLELKPWDIPAIMVRCGTIQTAAPERTARELEAAMVAWPLDRLDLYRESLLAEQRELARLDQRRTSPEAVARVIETALLAVRPRLRYRVGRLSGMAAAFELLPQPVVDLVMARRV